MLITLTRNFTFSLMMLLTGKVLKPVFHLKIHLAKP